MIGEIHKIQNSIKKISRDAKKQEHVTPNEKNQSMETSWSLSQMIGLAGKDIKIIMISIFHTFKTLTR
jgi:hypothetical protein